MRLLKLFLFCSFCLLTSGCATTSDQFEVSEAQQELASDPLPGSLKTFVYNPDNTGYWLDVKL